MHLYQRQSGIAHHVRGVGQRVRVMRECGRVHHHRGLLVDGLMHPAHHLGLVVGLAHLDLQPERGAPLGALRAQRLKILPTVDVRLTHSEAAQIRSVDDYHLGHDALSFG